MNNNNSNNTNDGNYNNNNSDNDDSCINHNNDAADDDNKEEEGKEIRCSIMSIHQNHSNSNHITSPSLEPLLQTWHIFSYPSAS